MHRSGLAVLAALICASGLEASAMAQAPRAPSTAPATAPAQPPRAGAAPAPTASEAKRSLSYRACLRAARKRNLRGAERRSFVTRCPARPRAGSALSPARARARR